MPIKNVVVNCVDVERSVEYYTRFLELELVGEVSPERAVLDAVTATVELRTVGNGREQSTWSPDDLQKGFRHLGFKVDRLDERAEALKAGGVEFKLDPLDAEGEVRICFFYDPDGTLLEMIQGDLQYAEIMDADGVARERALGVPSRPRFDHIAVTIEDRDATAAHYHERHGFDFIGTIEQPHDSRGFHIGYLKGGDTVLEVFTYDVPKTSRDPQLDVAGFAYAELEGDPPDLPVAISPDGTKVYVDSDGFAYAVGSGA
ncbi:catechol 2,3-dioxygenase-like lactoylglutathione lyase family enzyme [Kribbella sp. VKM Ac-2569]|uniref:VOC family protein n=1 Tax=Kribbella sp. VKM Ac-2569 TaxID=2512220 RepID=UPI00102B01F3|nr:VOC family protein [Kribbella sp. VKM Ac-2569]RZT17622.1 catechol 2,3-dioxygenase-like lactoylglutathione lyase family enzyme [Kribbella sp. VKM Ac-2569]